MRISKDDMIKSILLLRYGSARPRSTEHRVLTYAQIAQQVDRSISFVRRICRSAVGAVDAQCEKRDTFCESRDAKRENQDTLRERQIGIRSKIISKLRPRRKPADEPRWRRSKLTQQHLDFLTDPKTLRQWTGMTLEERRRMFHRQFPEIKISLYYLRLAYRQAGIKKKAVRIKKTVTEKHRAKIREEALRAKMGVREAMMGGHRIIYLDELCTTRRTLATQDWSEVGHYPKTDFDSFHQKTIATIAAISVDKGVELVMNFDRSVDKPKFMQFLRRLRAKNPDDRIAIFFDQLSVHKSNDVKEEAARLDMLLIFNATYSPNFNPIEGVIGLAKAEIKRMRWQNIETKKWKDDRSIINEAFRRIKKT